MESRNYIATPPGASIKEQLEYRGLTYMEFAALMGLTEKEAADLIDGKTLLDAGLADKLQSVLGIPSSFWNKLEAIYRNKTARVKGENLYNEERPA